MGMKSKSIRSERRKAEKRTIKAARRALYASYASAGRKKNSKRSRTSKHHVPFVKHAVSYCGNPGCKRCFSELYKVTP